MFPIKQLYPFLILAESDDEEDEYISEDRETETKRNRKTAQRVQTAILQDLRQTLGAAATLPEEAAKDLVLQVNLALLTAMLIIKHHHNSNRYLIFIVIIHFFFSFFLYIQEIRRIQIGCKLQEAASKYQYEGFSRIYIACTSMNTQKLIDLLETMFGDMDMDDINISKLEAETTQNLHKEAETAEAASITTETRAISKDKIMRVYITSLPVPPEFGIPPQSLPEMENVKERSVKKPCQKGDEVLLYLLLLPSLLTEQSFNDDTYPKVFEY